MAIFTSLIEIFSPLLVVNSEPICCEHILADWTANLLRTYYLYVILSCEMSLLLCNTQVKQQRAILNLDNQTLIACSDGTQYLSFLNQYTYFADYQYQIGASVSVNNYSLISILWMDITACFLHKMVQTKCVVIFYTPCYKLFYASQQNFVRRPTKIVDSKFIITQQTSKFYILNLP